MRQRSRGKISDMKSSGSGQNSFVELVNKCSKQTSAKRLHDTPPKSPGRSVRFRSICEEILDNEESGCSSPESFDIEREELPNGSDVFQQILREMTGGPDDFEQMRSDSAGVVKETKVEKVEDADKTTVKKQELRPKKSILKRRKNSRTSMK